MTQKKSSKRIKLTREELLKRNELLDALTESGEFDRLKNELYSRCLMEEAWRDEMKEGTRVAVKQSGGISEVTLDELVSKLHPIAKAHAPVSAETEIKGKLRSACFGT